MCVTRLKADYRRLLLKRARATTTCCFADGLIKTLLLITVRGGKQEPLRNRPKHDGMKATVWNCEYLKKKTFDVFKERTMSFCGFLHSSAIILLDNPQDYGAEKSTKIGRWC